jgi:hypothetical protein
VGREREKGDDGRDVDIGKRWDRREIGEEKLVLGKCGTE